MLTSLQSAGRPRRALTVALAMLLALPALAAPPGPPPRSSGGGSRPPAGGGQHTGQARPPQPQQPHLGEWMQNHQHLSPQDQERALQNEKGFRSLPPQQQQRLANRLHDLNNLPPDARQRVLNRTEALERLSPQQRQQVRGAMQSMATLPADRQRVVGQAFRELRNVPPDQREAILNGGRYRGQMSDQERSVLNGLFQVQPILPSSHDDQGHHGPQE
jgi:hypothetical protein